jgi:hypothetical protein
MYAIIHFPPKKTRIHNHLDHPPGSSHIFASRFAQVKLIDLGRSGNAGGSPQPRWRRGTQRIRPRDVNGGSWENPWGKLIDEKSSKKMTIFFSLPC